MNLGAWPEHFVDYVALRLARKCCFRITGSNGREAELKKDEDRARRVAKAEQAMNDPPGLPPVPFWARARRGAFGPGGLWLGGGAGGSVCQIANVVGNLAIDCRSLYLLAAPSTPQEARDEVIERAEDGERLTQEQIKEIVDKAVNAEIEPKLEALRAEAFQREAELRAEYEGAGQAKIDKAVNKATVPFQKQIQKYEERLAKIKERDEARAARAKSGADPQPKTGNNTDPAQSAAAMAAAHAANEGEGAADTKPAKKSKRPPSQSQPPPHTRSPRTAPALPKPPR